MPAPRPRGYHARHAPTSPSRPAEAGTYAGRKACHPPPGRPEGEVLMRSGRRRVSAVAEGVFLLERAAVNCYLVVDDEGIVLIDGGLPRMWPLLLEALEQVG